MIFLRLLTFAVVCSLFPIASAAQTDGAIPSPLPLPSALIAQRDTNAVAILQVALVNLSGATVANPSVIATGDVQYAGAANASGSFTWKRAGREFRYENPDGSILVSGKGRPALASAGIWKRTSGNELISDFPSHLPGIVIARVLADARYEIRSLGARALNGGFANVVSITRIYPDDSDGFFAALTRRTFYFDASSSSLLRVEYDVPDNVYAGTRALLTVDYQQFATVGGLNVPVRFTISLNGQLFATYTIKTVVQVPISAQEFVGGAQ
jgi:hypothetical protein